MNQTNQNSEVQKKLEKTLEIENLSQKDKEGVIRDLGEIVLARVSARIMKNLDEVKKKEFKDLIEKEDQDSINKFLSENVPNLEKILNEIVSEEVKLFKENT